MKIFVFNHISYLLHYKLQAFFSTFAYDTTKTLASYAKCRAVVCQNMMCVLSTFYGDSAKQTDKKKPEYCTNFEYTYSHMRRTPLPHKNFL